ncbi:hypothetical protein PT974_10370 [Cladobotryum mycophilum]|uniref:Aminoglycoside phosphotransferase domain-containing protein n=1 Tax=Cladobotryum mycophilum TaxID=491253 RepID=A0ABR0S9T7_9HYPO
MLGWSWDWFLELKSQKLDIATCPVAGINDESFMTAMSHELIDGRFDGLGRWQDGWLESIFYTENKKWVVRIPTEPALYDAWGKLQREVATMQYVQRNTAIPIQKIIAYGRDQQLTTTGLTTPAFLILDYVPGQSFNKKAFITAKKEDRLNFYAELLEVFVQLRDLEFPLAGSLMPAADDGREPVVGEVITIATNHLQQEGRDVGDRSAFTSTTDYIWHLYYILSQIHEMPIDGASREDIEMQIFSLDNLKGLIPEFIDSRSDKGPFLLMHPDLRVNNIIVDENFHIQGIIDWEWTGTVPLQMFTPPAWITGQDLDHRAEIRGIDIFAEFRDALQAKGRDSSRYDKLVEDWSFEQKFSIPIAHILLHPSSLELSYSMFIHPTLFKESYTKAAAQTVPQYFSENGRAEQLQKRLDESERYTEYLKEHGLFVPTPPEQLELFNQIRELDERRKRK